PTARMAPVSRSMATTDGSRTTMPFPFTATRVLAVPKSIPMSRARRPNMPHVLLSGPVRPAGLAPAGPRRAPCVQRKKNPSKNSLLLQTDVAAIAHDEVVQHLDPQQAPRLGQPPGKGDVLGAGLGIAAGVVVHQNDG